MLHSKKITQIPIKNKKEAMPTYIHGRVENRIDNVKVSKLGTVTHVYVPSYLEG